MTKRIRYVDAKPHTVQGTPFRAHRSEHTVQRRAGGDTAVTSKKAAGTKCLSLLRDQTQSGQMSAEHRHSPSYWRNNQVITIRTTGGIIRRRDLGRTKKKKKSAVRRCCPPSTTALDESQRQGLEFANTGHGQTTFDGVC